MGKLDMPHLAGLHLLAIPFEHGNSRRVCSYHVRGCYYSPGSNDLAGSTGAARVKAGTLTLSNLPVYADNAAALGGGLTAGQIYRTSTGVLMVTY